MILTTAVRPRYFPHDPLTRARGPTPVSSPSRTYPLDSSSPNSCSSHRSIRLLHEVPLLPSSPSSLVLHATAATALPSRASLSPVLLWSLYYRSSPRNHSRLILPSPEETRSGHLAAPRPLPSSLLWCSRYGPRTPSPYPLPSSSIWTIGCSLWRRSMMCSSRGGASRQRGRWSSAAVLQYEYGGVTAVL